MLNQTLILALLFVSLNPASAMSLEKRTLIYNCDGVHFDRSQIMGADPEHCVFSKDQLGKGIHRMEFESAKKYRKPQGTEKIINRPLFRSKKIDYGENNDRNYSVTLSWIRGTHSCRIIGVFYHDQSNQKIECDIRKEAASFRMPNPEIASSHFRAKTDFSGAPPARGFGLID